MTISTSVQNFLESQHVNFDVVRHPMTWCSTQTAQACHVSGNRVAKAVVLKDDTGYVLAILPASHHIQFHRLNRWLGRHLSMVSEEEAAQLFKDCEPGAFPPLGDAYGLESVIEESLDEAPEIFFEGGDHASLLHMPIKQFEKLMRGAPHGSFSIPA